MMFKHPLIGAEPDHEIGIQFDPIYYKSQIADSRTLENRLIYEKAIFSEIAESTTREFSFYRPSMNKLLHKDNEQIGASICIQRFHKK